MRLWWLTRRRLSGHAGPGRHRGLTHRRLSRRGLPDGRLAGSGLTGGVRSGAVQAGPVLARCRLAGNVLAGNVLAVRRELPRHRLPRHLLSARHRLSGRRPAVAGSTLLWVGLAGRALLTRVLRSLLPTWSGAVLAGTLLAGTLRTGSGLVRTLLVRTVLGRDLRHAGLARAVLARRRLPGTLLRVLAGRRTVLPRLALLAGSAVLAAGGRAAVLLARWRRLDPVGVVRVLRRDRATLLGTAWAGLRRVRSGRTLAVRRLRTRAGVPTLRAALLPGLLALSLLRVLGVPGLRVPATGRLFSFVLLGGRTLTWHS
jgi:hypothetical protein